MQTDQFERYYAEKLWDAIPAVYRRKDGLAESPGTLRALVQVLASQAAIVRRSQDRLWEDEFIESCDEWAVPYIGDLVATRLLSALNKRGRRIDVAKTIYYRRRKGTPRILEELISDISGWEGKLVEQFQRLARSFHGLDTLPDWKKGRYSGTMPGGWADLRNPRISELADGPFEEYFHTPEFRRHQGLEGRYAIPKLAFYLYRLKAYPVIHTAPFAMGDGQSFLFDPSGRDIPLFSKRLRPNNWDDWYSAKEWELPAPIPCRLLAHAEYEITGADIRQLTASGLSAGAALDLNKILGLRFKSESSLRTLIESFSSSAEILLPANYDKLLALTLVADCGKQALLPAVDMMLTDPMETSSIVVGFETPADEIVSVENTTAANLQNWSANTDKTLAVDPERGRFRFTTATDSVHTIYCSYHYGFSTEIGAGSYDRPKATSAVPDQLITGGGAIVAGDLLNNGIVRITDSKTYGPVANKLSVEKMELQAATGERPYLRIETDWVLNTGTHENATLILDGLWVGAAGNLAASLVLRGNYEKVIIRNCTLDPGGDDNGLAETLFPVTLSIDGFVETLCIESSIVGPISVTGNGLVEELCINDTILQSVDRSVPVLSVPAGITTINRCTLFGSSELHELFASEIISTGQMQVLNTQEGCFRFSAAPSSSKLPRPYESFLFEKDANHWFNARLFGSPAFAQLSDTAPLIIRTGAENGSEMGAFSALMNPIKENGLHIKTDEYMPFGLISLFIHRT